VGPGRSAAETEAVLAGTAATFYRLGTPPVHPTWNAVVTADIRTYADLLARHRRPR
jgi:hypothetical protein